MKTKQQQRNILTITAYTFILISCIAMSGCGSMVTPTPDDPKFAPTIPDVSEMPKAKNGSLFVENVNTSLYEDIKAHQIGDILTVKLAETTQASKDAKTNLNKKHDISTTIGAFFGGIPSFSIKKLPLIHSDKNKTLNNSIDIQNLFKGYADTQQNNSLKGEISVTVAQILPNSNLVIRGEKWITLNQGSEFIRISGIVRPKDIGPNNEVLSTKIANARITYSGTGDLANANKMGWLGKLFNCKLSPF